MIQPTKSESPGRGAAIALEGRIRECVSRGDLAAAATEAIRALGPQVVHYLRSVLHDEDDAGDAFSEFAEGVWRGLPHFRWEASLRTWAFRLAWNAALNVRDVAWRRHGRRLATGEASKIAEEIRTKSFARIERQREGLAKLVASLPLEDQSLFALRIAQGLAWAEIAAVLSRDGHSVDENTVAKRFSRLKERLSRMAKAQGLLD
jgi:RNA polymerase sigma-70 factor (ECF subfamily)